MSHIADQIQRPVESSYIPEKQSRQSRWFVPLVAVAMLAHTFIAYAKRPAGLGTAGIGLEFLLGLVNLVAVVYLFYSLARLAHSGRHLFLWSAAVISIVIALVTAESLPFRAVLTGWLAILIPSVLSGVLAKRNASLSRIYLFSTVAIIIMTTIQFFPLWSQIVIEAQTSSQQFAVESEQLFLSFGFSQSLVNQVVPLVKELFVLIIRLLPALTLMSSILYFTIGIWLFARWAYRNGSVNMFLSTFIRWKMPFAFIPIMIVAILMRLSGVHMFTLIADNLVLILATFYSVTGLSLMEFLMKRFRFRLWGRMIVYLLLIISHVIGFALLVLMGFADSFFDWRRKYPLPMEVKTG